MSGSAVIRRWRLKPSQRLAIGKMWLPGRSPTRLPTTMPLSRRISPGRDCSRAAFYDADGNEELYRQREKEMVDSCVRFIDFDKIDCIPMSEYILNREGLKIVGTQVISGGLFFIAGRTLYEIDNKKVRAV